jgi:hypothetical protein
VNDHCNSCVTSPKEIVVIASPVNCSTYYYQAIDNSWPACACGSGAASGLLRVYVNGALVETNPFTTSCGQQTSRFPYTYAPGGCLQGKSNDR